MPRPPLSLTAHAFASAVLMLFLPGALRLRGPARWASRLNLQPRAGASLLAPLADREG